MKNIEIKFILFAIFLLTIKFSSAQSYEIRTHENDLGYIEVQMRETTGGTNLPSNTDGDLIGDIAYAIRWSSSLGTDVSFLCSEQDYNMRDPSGVVHTDEPGWHYRYYTAESTPFLVPTDWIINEWVTISTYYAIGGSGTNGSFEIAPQNFGISTLNWAIAEGGTPPYNQSLPSINGSISNYSYPTLVYNYVWKGGAAPPPNFKKWNVSGNWTDECSNSAASYPYGAGNENVYVPSGLTYYPEETSGGDDYAFICDELLIATGAHITVPNLSAQSTNAYFAINGDAKIYGKLYLPALGYATVTGNTDIENTEGIEVQADVTGVGSFIDNGTITYGTTGSGKVETYITNGAVANSFYMHTVGPTVDVASAGGAPLSAFDLATGSTYAYNWDETQPNADGWQNIFSNNYLVSTGDGIAFSTTDATDYTLEMTGEFITGNTSPPALTHSNNFNELISNPYPSAIDFDAFYAANSGVINNGYWIWNPSAGNWEIRTGGSGSQQFIQVGQAFFVETNSAGTVQFTNAIRAHSNDAFRETTPNMLTMHVSGGDMGYSDKLIVRFTQESTNGFDINLDGAKWTSMYADATMIRTIAEDNSELAINVLPLDGLQGKMVSVPVRFNCGYTSDYTFDFEGIDSFEAGNEVWLEDKKDSDHWIYLNDNPHYTFTAASYGNPDRFIIHFFGPTSINDKDEARVDIYSSGQYAYIKNVTNEKIKKVSIYNIAGSLVTSRTIPDGQKLSKIWVSDHMAYYVVQVITESNVYTNKILITK